MDFCFKRAGGLMMATGAFALTLSLVDMPAKALAAAGGQAAPAAQPNWKDQAEYAAFQKVQTATDPKARLEALHAWEDKYPNTEFTTMRLQYYTDTLSRLAPADPTQRQPLLQKAQDLLKADAKNANAMYLVALWAPIVGAASPTPDLISQAQTAGHSFISEADAAFADANKPAQLSAADWAKVKTQRLSVAHNALAWAAAANKDAATAEAEYKQSLTVNPDQGTTAALFAKTLFEDKKFADALFQYARTAQYTGPGPAQSPAGRQASMDFFNKLYKQFHGSDDGKDQVLSAAKTSALPPDGFAITSLEDAMKKEQEGIEARMAGDPAFKLWYTVKSNLVTDQGAAFFDSNVKDTEIPAGANGVKYFSATVLTVEPAEKPTKVTLGLEDPTKADTTLTFSNPLPASALEKIKFGAKIEFDGVAESYTKEPFMLTFKDPEISGVQLTAPPKKTPARRHK